MASYDHIKQYSESRPPDPMFWVWGQVHYKYVRADTKIPPTPTMINTRKRWWQSRGRYDRRWL